MVRLPKNIDPATAVGLVEAGALLVDVREANEVAALRIPGAHHAALSRLDGEELPLAPGQAVVFFCASGGRTAVHAARLAAKAGSGAAHVLQGGIAAWGRSGLPVESSRGRGGQPSSIFARLFAR